MEDKTRLTREEFLTMKAINESTFYDKFAFTIRGLILKELVEHNPPGGIHLTEKGKRVLGDYIFNTL
jgi:hypothetical protein